MTNVKQRLRFSAALIALAFSAPGIDLTTLRAKSPQVARPSDSARVLVKQRLPVYSSEIDRSGVSVDVSVITEASPSGRVSLIKEEAVVPHTPAAQIPVALARALFAAVTRAVGEWEYAPGPLATRYRVVFDIRASTTPPESHPHKLVIVEPYVSASLLPQERRVLVQGHLFADGTLGDVKVEGAGALEPIVLAAVRQWRYAPGSQPSAFAALVALHPDSRIAHRAAR